ncbi:MAG: helix-turn-helix domain-containing protein [Bacteroidetes bacterium]|nr:helix-turn-helix domain-containing protein [Bacteroidota bacterium]
METSVQLEKELEVLLLRLEKFEEELNTSIFRDRDWLEGREVCKWLKISRRTLDRWCKAKLLPHCKLGKNLFFLVSEIDKVLWANRVVTVRGVNKGKKKQQGRTREII